MITKETLTIKKAELLAEAEINAKMRVKEFVENALTKINESNENVMRGEAYLSCPSYLDPRYVGEELKAAGFELKKSDVWTFIIKW
jgi:hypothetical protein